MRRAGKACQSIRGRDVDAAVSELVLRTVAPAAIEVALAVQQEIAGRIEQAGGARQKQIERARYEAELKRRRFLKCDPDHRLVADALEADWNEQLRRLETLQQQHERQHLADQGLLNEQARTRILALARDFPCVWHDPHTDPRDRKRMLALLIEDVTLTKGDTIAIHVRFRAGQTTSLTVPAPKPISQVRKFKPEVITALDRLLDTCTEQEAADRLNALGYRNWKQQPMTRATVFNLRVNYKLKSRFQRLRDEGFISAESLAQRLHVSTTTIHEWGRAGSLVRQRYGNHVFLYKPVQPGTIHKGQGGRRPRAPSFTVPGSKRETV